MTTTIHLKPDIHFGPRLRVLRSPQSVMVVAFLTTLIAGCKSTRNDGSSLDNPHPLVELPHIAKMSIEPGVISLFGPGHLEDPTSCSYAPWKYHQGDRFTVFGHDEVYRYRIAVINESNAIFELEIEDYPCCPWLPEYSSSVIKVAPYDIDAIYK